MGAGGLILGENNGLGLLDMVDQANESRRQAADRHSLAVAFLQTDAVPFSVFN